MVLVSVLKLGDRKVSFPPVSRVPAGRIDFPFSTFWKIRIGGSVSHPPASAADVFPSPDAHNPPFTRKPIEEL